MAKYANLKAVIAAYVKTNGAQQITGQGLQNILVGMVDIMGKYFQQFGGLATPAGSFTAGDENVAFLAVAAGTYTNFGGFELDGSTLHVFTYDGDWTDIDTGIPSGSGLTTAIDTALLDYAKKIGYYEQFRAGLADNLFSPISVIQKYLFGPTAEGSEVASGAAFLRAFKGNGVAWNQLAPLPTTGSTSLYTLTRENGHNHLVANAGDSALQIGLVSFAEQDRRPGHKYYITANSSVDGGSDTFDIIYYLGGSSASAFTSKNGIIVTAGSTNNWSMCIRVKANAEVDITFNYQLIDLTLAGIDNLTTAAQVEDWLRKNVGAKPYYANNAGTLLGAALKGFKSWKTANLLNPTTKTARLFEYTYGEAVNKYTIQQLPADASLYFTPDATGVEAEVTMDDTTHFSVSGQGTLAVKTSDGSAAYSGDVSEVWLVAYYDGAMDSYDNYKPFAQDVKTIDAGKIYYDNAGTKTKVWADGVMKAAGSAQDELRYDDIAGRWKATLPVGTVNLGTLDYTYGSSAGNEHMRTIGIRTRIKKPSEGSVKANLLCSKYIAASANAVYSHSAIEAIGVGTDGTVYIYSASMGTDADAFKTAMNGVPLWYELATPLTYDTLYYSEDGETFVPLEDVLTPDLLANNWAAQEVEVSDYVDGNPTAVTPEVEIEYMEDAVEALKTYKDEAVLIEDQHDQVQAVLEALKTANIISEYTIADAPTSGTKVFAVSVTKYTE